MIIKETIGKVTWEQVIKIWGKVCAEHCLTENEKDCKVVQDFTQAFGSPPFPRWVPIQGKNK